MADRAVAIHGHFYQPPRENPWLEAVEVQDSAAPYHDWNERVTAECYAPNTAARRVDSANRILDIVNNFEKISFNVGPTLMTWLERHAPDVYARVLDADRLSAQARNGHGNAIAQIYNHMILPLATRRDKVTQTRWGLADFRHRFGREPEGMWLPETAVDDETLDVLAAEGIRFTILAPHQVERVPAGGRPGWHRTAGGRRIALFLYDGALSHDVAFGPLVRDPAAWIERLTAGDRPELVSIATDGETFGHHHREGAVTLARVLEALRQRSDVRVDTFAAFLARHPPQEDVRLVAPSAWSCPHGVERWRSDCGCRVHGDRATHQRWRAPLRSALDWLAAELHGVFEREGGTIFSADPWTVRDVYGAVLGAPDDNVTAFIGERLRHPDDR